MLFRSRLALISRKWRPHSEQLKQWIVASANDITKLSVARTYVSDIGWQEALGDIDDCTEAAWLLHRVGFSRDSSVFMSLRKEVWGLELGLTSEALKAIASFCESDEAAFDSMCSIFLTQPSSLTIFREAFAGLITSEKLRFARIFWKSSYSGNVQRAEYWGLSNVIAEVLGDSVKSEPNDLTDILKCLIAMSAPVWDESHEALRVQVERISCNLAPFQSLGLLREMDQRRDARMLASHWFSCLRSSFASAPRAHTPSPDEWVALSTILIKTNRVLSEVEVANLQLSLRVCSADDLIRFCESIAAARSEAVAGLRPCLAWIHQKAGRVLHDSTASSEEKALYFLCYASIDRAAGRKELSDFLESNCASVPSPQTVAYILRTLAKLDIYPANVVQRLASAVDAESQTQTENVYLLNALVQSGLPVRSEIVSKACAGTLVRQFTRRNGQKMPQRGLDDEAAVILITSLAALTAETHGIHGGPIAVSMVEEIRLEPVYFAKLLSKLSRLPAASNVRRAAFSKGIGEVGGCSSSALTHALMDTMRSVGIRDVAGYEKLLACLKSLPASLEASTVLSAVTTAQSLQLVPQFERSRLLQAVESFDTWEKGDILALIRCSSPNVRRWLMSIPAVETAVREVRTSAAPAADSLILFNTLPLSERQSLLGHMREPSMTISRGEVSTEDAVVALERTKDMDERAFQVVFRVSSSVLEDVSEPQLMRLLRRLAELPKCPNYVFRVLGKAVLRLVDTMSANNALLWLRFYTENHVRDDSVGKALIRKASSRHASLSKIAALTLERGADFYGQAVRVRPNGKKKGPRERKAFPPQQL